MLGEIKSVTVKDKDFIVGNKYLYANSLVTALRKEEGKTGLFISITTTKGQTMLMGSKLLSHLVVYSDVIDKEFKIRQEDIKKVYDLHLTEANFELLTNDEGEISAKINFEEQLYTEKEVYDHLSIIYNIVMGLKHNDFINNKADDLNKQKHIETLNQYWQNNKK